MEVNLDQQGGSPGCGPYIALALSWPLPVFQIWISRGHKHVKIPSRWKILFLLFILYKLGLDNSYTLVHWSPFNRSTTFLWFWFLSYSSPVETTFLLFWFLSLSPPVDNLTRILSLARRRADSTALDLRPRRLVLRALCPFILMIRIQNPYRTILSF